MFAVEELEPFPTDAQAFSTAEDAERAVAAHGLELDMSMCASCPRVSTTMALPHIFSHKYCGMQFLERGQEEWQMCQLVCSFVKDNKKELEDDTCEYFKSSVVSAKSLVRYATALSKCFQSPDALQLYLLARVCNAHTRVFFQNFVWSTVASNASFYVAVNLAVIGQEFIALRSPEQGTLQCVIGEVRMFVPGEVDSGNVSSEVSENDSNLGEDGEVADSEAESEIVCDKLVQNCAVPLKRLPLYIAFPTLAWRVSVPVEHLSWSLLFPGRIFRSERTPHSQLFPGHVFKATPRPNWTACTVPVEKVSRSTKMPGKMFSSHSVPFNRLSVSSRLPSRMFSSHSKPMWKWTACTVLKENVPRSVGRPGVKFVSEAKYTQKCNAPVPRRFQPVLSLTRVSRDTAGSGCPVLMFHCRVCQAVVEKSRVKLKRHVELSHGLYTCKNAHCVAAFKSESARTIHSAVHMKKVRTCDKCGRQFSHRFALERYMALHAMKWPHKCNVCGRRYFRLKDLKEHITMVHESAVYACDACVYKGWSQRALKQHALVHKLLALKCDWCEETFRWRSQLAAHMCE